MSDTSEEQPGEVERALRDGYERGGLIGPNYGLPSEPPPRRKLIPPPGPLSPGQIFFSSKIHVLLTKLQQKKLGAVNVGTKNKCRKSRPWVVLNVDEDLNFITVMCSTTREKKGWAGVRSEWSESFLPIEPTQSEFGKPIVRLADDARGVFTGSSLLFLEIEKQATRNSLGDYIGSLTPEGLEVINRHRMSQAGTRTEPLQLIRHNQQNQSHCRRSAGRNRSSSNWYGNS